MPDYTYPIPYLTTQLPRNKCANSGLLFDRYVGYLVQNDEWSLKATGASNPKRDALNKVIDAQKRFVTEWATLREGLITRWMIMAKDLGATERDGTLFKASPVWRFVTGLGRNSPLEVGFTFDRVYGLPIIPGSGLKGLTRAYVLCQWAEEMGVPLVRADEAKARREKKPRERTPLEQFEILLTSEKDKQKQLIEELRRDRLMSSTAKLQSASDDEVTQRADLFRCVFGTISQKGRTIFLDAAPKSVTLEIDVMTPHYPEYYKQDSTDWPTDWQNPNPVPFLTVGYESVFYFAVAGTEQEQVAKWLRLALDWPGAGAKTSAGYGAWETEFLPYESVWRKAVVRQVNPTRLTVTLEDIETGERHTYAMQPTAITPGKGYTCEYSVVMEGDKKLVNLRNVHKPIRR